MQGPPLKDWLKQIPAEDREHYDRIGMVSSLHPGARNVLIVVDYILGFCGREGLGLELAAREFPTGCGPAAWEAMPRARRLVDHFRRHDWPVVFTCASDDQKFAGLVTTARRPNWPPPHFNDFPAPVAPRNGDWVMGKTKASAFFQTPLTTYLTRHHVDTVTICGISTSGCVRATAVDSWSHGYTTFVVDDCCADRSYYAHCANLFDLHGKYATVVSLSEVEQQFVAGADEAQGGAARAV